MVLSFQEGTSIKKTKKLEDFLDRWSSQLLRAKGYVSVNGEGSCLLQYALKRAVWQKSNYKGPSYLVLIGLNLDWDKLFAEWESLFGHPAALI